jgi:hypothetical protein
VHVMLGSKDWGWFNYCAEARAEDKRNGYTVLFENVSCSPETDDLWHRYTTWEGGKVQPADIFRLARRLERERDTWKARFSDAVERLEGKLHCADNCKCSGRREVNMLRSFILENKELSHP